MNLIGGDQPLLADAERRGHARAVLRDLGRQVVRAHAAIETRIESIGHAAVAGEEGMTDASKSTERCGLEHVGLISVPPNHASGPRTGSDLPRNAVKLAQTA